MRAEQIIPLVMVLSVPTVVLIVWIWDRFFACKHEWISTGGGWCAECKKCGKIECMDR